MSEKTLPQMALFAPHLAPAAPEMASVVTKMAVEMSAVPVGSARYWIDFPSRCVQSFSASVSPVIGQVGHRCSSSVSFGEHAVNTKLDQSRADTALSVPSIIGATENLLLTKRSGFPRFSEGLANICCALIYYDLLRFSLVFATALLKFSNTQQLCSKSHGHNYYSQA